MVKYTIMDKLEKEIELQEKAISESVRKVITEEEKKKKEQEKKEERRKMICSMFEMLSGIKMNDDLFNEYNNEFNKEKKGFNIKTFMREKGIRIKEEEEKENREL